MPFDTVESLIRREADKELPAPALDLETRRALLTNSLPRVSSRVAQLIEAGDLPVFVRDNGKYIPAPPEHCLRGQVRAFLDGERSELRQKSGGRNYVTGDAMPGRTYEAQINREWLTGLYVESGQSLDGTHQDESAGSEGDGKIKQSKDALALVIGLLSIDIAQRCGHKDRGNPNATGVAGEVEALIDSLTKEKGFQRPKRFGDRTVEAAIAAGLAAVKAQFRDDGVKILPD